MARTKSITETGPKPLRGIRNRDIYGSDQDIISPEERREINNFYQNSTKRAYYGYKGATTQNPFISDSLYEPQTRDDLGDWGNSMYDNNALINPTANAVNDARAENQPWYAQLGAGIMKGVGLAGTTFLDGTLGLLAGISEGIYNAANGGGWEGFGEGFYNNEISRALREFNKEMEEILPNYRTQDEINNPWALRNIFSMNTFADDFLKNMGFTVGAFYSGNAFLGALKGVGLATRISKTAASTIGSVVSGFNEGRIEAGNLYDEMLTAELGNLQAARDQAKQDVLNSPEYQAAGQSLVDEYNQKKAAIDAMPDKMIPNGEGGFVSQKQQALLQLGNEYSGKLSQLEQQALANIDRRYEEQVKDAQHRAAQAGIADMILNTLYLPAENMFAYGKLYGRKFKPKADLKKGVKEKAIDVAAREADLEETMGKRIAREGKEYVATPRSAKKAALRGLGVGISEGAEEINQSAMSSFASNLYQPDSPDAYYKALTNDDYHMETKDAMTAFSEAMVDSWGNPGTYKEGLVGFLTGLIGMPTFGRVNNADANTYLGRNKMIGLSGGILGELSNNRRLNAEAASAVDAMNKVVQLAADTENFFVRMNSFYNAKSGFSEENDKFEFNNAADNELFHAIDAFRRSGRMQDLKDIIDENFDDITPEQLADIAEKTTGEDNLWSDLDGTSMAATPDGQARMKSILNDRKKEIMEGIDAYEKALDEVRSIANNSLDDDQTAELAWLKWKVDKFGKRFADIKDKNKDLFTDISNALLNYRDELQEGIDDSVEASEDNIAVQELNKTNNLIKFITALQGAPTPMALSAILEANPDFVKYFTRTDSQFAGYDSFNGMLGVSYDQYERAWNELRDCTRLAKAARDFDARYKEFTEDPMKLIKNRQQIDAQNAKQEESKKNLKGRNLLDSENVSDIVKAVDNGEMSLEDMQKLIDADAESDVKDQRQQMYDNAAAILKRAQELEDKLNAMAGEPGADQQAIEDAKRQLEKQKYLAQNAEQLTDTNTEAMNTLDMSDDDVQRALAAGQALEDAESARIDAAKEVLKTAEAQLEESQQALGNMPTAMPQGLEEAVAAAEAEETGHDGPTAAPAVNEPQAQDGPTPVNYYNIAYNDINALLPAYSEDIKTNTANALARLYANIDSKHREGTLNKQDGILFEATDDFKTVGRLIGDNNARVLLASRVNKVLTNDAAQLAPSDPAPVTNQDPVTPDTSNTEAIERQIDAEANRSLDEDGRQDSYNYWKRTTTQYFIHSARAAWEKTIDWIKRQGKSPQQVRRTEAVYQFLEDHHAWDNINAGAVEMKGRKGPTIKFVTSKSLNEKAGEFVVLMVDSQGRIVGDLGSKNDIGTHRQVGLVDFLDAAEKEYNEKKDSSSEDIIPLTGETTVLQNLVGRVDYAPKDQRRSLNEIWGGKKFIIALARKSGKNSGMRTNSLSLSATGGKDEIGDYTLSPLDAVAGQPYVLVESSDPARRYIPVPFSMPVFSPATANSALGQAILKVLMTVSEEDFKTIRDPLRALLAVEDVRIGWGNKDNKDADNITLTIQRNGKKEYYHAKRSDPNAGTVLFNKLAQAGIPFHVNRAFINGIYGPTGQSYNEMIGELAQTNLNSTHTVGDWFTVNPIGAKGTRMKSIGVNPEAEANQKAAEAVAARSARRITVKYQGFEYTVDKDTWKVYNSEGKELLGSGFTMQIVALAQCQLNGYDTTKPGPYKIPLGWYNPVTGALNRGAAKPTQKTQNTNVENLTREDFVREITSGQTNEFSVRTENSLVPINDTIRDPLKAKAIALNMLTMFKSAKNTQELHDSIVTRGWAFTVNDLTNIYNWFRAFKNGNIGDKEVLAMFDHNAAEKYRQELTATSQPQEQPQTPTQKQQRQYQFPEKQTTLLPVPSYASENPWSVGKNGANKRKISGGQTILTGEAIQSYVNVINYAIKAGIIRGVELIDGPEGSGAKYITEDDWDDAVEQLEELGFKTPRELAIINPHTYDVKAVRKAARQKQDSQAPAQPQGQQPQQSSTPQAGQENMQQLASQRVANSKLLHKEDIKDVRSDVDEDLIVVTKHRAYPDSLEVIITLNKGALDVKIQPVAGVTLQQGSPEFNVWDTAKFVPKNDDRKQRLADYYIPKELQDFIVSGKFYDMNNASSKRGNELYSKIEDVINYIMSDPNSGNSMLLNKWGIPYINNYSGDYLEEVSNPQQEVQPSQDVLAKMADILDDDVKQAVWDSLTDEQKQALASKSTKKIEQILDTIVEEAWDGTKVDNFESYLGARFRRGEINRTSRKWNEKKERAWLKQVLPQFSGHRLKVLGENLIQISGGENPTWAYGQFKNGIITLGKAAAKGTLYHEAFHAVTWCLFNEQERHEMFDAAKLQYGIENPVALEEQLAEDFRRYVQLEELPVIGRLVRFFRTLRQFIRSLTGKENYIDKVFYSISRGAYANREIQNTDITRLNKPTAEEEEILRNAPRDAKGRLLAPNDKPSNLTERQYVQVRTKAFKNWFGDWENDHENASKVVDENGEPLVVYHGSPASFYVFDISKFGKTDFGSMGKGFYFSPDENFARKYGNTIGVFLNIKNPISETQQLEAFVLGSHSVKEVLDRIDKMVDMGLAEREQIEKVKPLITEDLIKAANKHDGTIPENFSESYAEIVAINSNQIKSATDNIGTFDPNNPDIRYRRVQPGVAAEHSMQNAKRHGIGIINSKPMNITRLGSYLNDMFQRYKNAFSNSATYKLEMNFLASLIEYLRAHNAINENGVLYKFVATKDETTNGYYNAYGIGIEKKVPLADEPIVLLHEIIHSTTNTAVKYPKTAAEKKFAAKLKALYNYVVEWNNEHHIIPKEEYGLTDFDEFIAELANPYFLEYLSYVEVDDRYKYKEENAQRIRKSNPNRSNALVQFLEAVKAFLVENFRNKATRAHAQLIAIYDEYLENSGKEKFDYMVTNSEGKHIRREGITTYANRNSEFRLRRDLRGFFDKFGIAFHEIADYNGEEPLFDALNRVINLKSGEDITEGAGYALAFMMQHQKPVVDLFQLYTRDPKSIRRGLKRIKEKPFSVRERGRKIQPEEKQEFLKVLGSEIARELRRAYGQEEEKSNFLGRIWEIIKEFFNMINPYNRAMFNSLQYFTQHVANSVKLGDKTIVLRGMTKPGTTGRAERVNIEQALKENPYEEGIIKKLSDEGIALGGSACIALAGTVYRPKENPLHDIDFNASKVSTKEEMNSIMNRLFPHNQHFRTITSDKGSTESYIVLENQNFTVRDAKMELTNEDGEKEEIDIIELVGTKGEVLGYLDPKNDLHLNEGLQGKVLDFFLGELNAPFGSHWMTLNGKQYLINDYRNAFAAKIAWARLKDIWDYNRFVPNEKLVEAPDVISDNSAVAARVKKAKVIWGHPALGKTTYIKDHKEEILEWDEEVNKKRFAFIQAQVDPDGLMSKEELEAAKQRYLREWRDHPEYIQFLYDEWGKLKERAIKENKQIFASPLPLLSLFAEDFDLIINLADYTFVKNNMDRGGGFYSSIDWKEAISEELAQIDPSKIVLTDAYFSDIMMEEAKPVIEQYHRDRLEYGNLSEEQKEYIGMRGISIEEYNRMSEFEREVLFECMGI